MDSLELWKTFMAAVPPEYFGVFKTINAVVLSAGLVFALLNCFFGYKLRRVWIAIFGFILGFLAGAALLFTVNANLPSWCYAAVGILVGLLISALANKLYKVAIFLWIFSTVYMAVIGLFPPAMQIPSVITGLVCGILLGFLAAKTYFLVTIGVTSVTGGMAAGGIIMRHFGQSGRTELLICGVIFVLLGLALQIFMNRKLILRHQLRAEAK